MIDVSTDKAVDPLNIYGTTKALGEKLIINASYKNSNTSFVCIRAGNVIGTNGSVIPLWKNQILNDGKITITDENMTRYFMTISQAIFLLLKAAEFAGDGETIVMKMPSLVIKDLKDIMIENFASGKEILIENIGLRLGEKIDEVLISKDESRRTYSIGEDFFVIIPYNFRPEKIKKYKIFNLIEFGEYSSKNTHIMSKKEIHNLLKNEGWV